MCHVRICIKENVEHGMTEAVVEGMMRRICRWQSSLTDMFGILTQELDHVVIMNNVRDDTTADVYGSEDQIALMRRIYETLQEDPWDQVSVLARDAEVAEAGRGPLFFNLMVIIYKHWSARWKGEDEPDSDGEDDDDDDMSEPSEDEDDDDVSEHSEDEDDDDMTEAGVSHRHEFPMRAGVDMGAMLNQLQELVK